MMPIGIVVLLAVPLAWPSATQSGRTGADGSGKGRPRAVEAASIQEAGPDTKGLAPGRVKLAEPIQPLQVEVREGGVITSDPRAKQRTVVRMMVNIERAHRDRVARLERLREIYEAAGAHEKLETVARLRELELSRYASALEGYERGLGPVLYGKVRAAIDGQGGKPPANPAPAAGSRGRVTGKSKSPAPVPLAPVDEQPR
jgi:hypothetical protein